MINPIAVAGCLAIGFGGLAYAFVGGDSRADKRRAAVTKTDAKASVAAGVDRAARKKQIAALKQDLPEYQPADWIQAKNFVDSLEYESRSPAT